MGIIKVGHKKLFLLVSNATMNPHLLKILQTGRYGYDEMAVTTWM